MPVTPNPRQNQPICPTTSMLASIGNKPLTVASRCFDSDIGMSETAIRFGNQSAALPFRITPGGLCVLLVTSRESRRWIIPKGWPIRGLKPRDVAAREAYEEAGLVGRIVGKGPIGSYHYSKRLPDGVEQLCRVKVFLLAVDYQVDEWPEKAQREWRWIAPAEAAQMVQEGGLAEILFSAFPPICRLEPIHAKRPRLPR
jgi:8-oxo-dGTP pyrophosphatase MutT (NUDIX family)